MYGLSSNQPILQWWFYGSSLQTSDLNFGTESHVVSIPFLHIFVPVIQQTQVLGAASFIRKLNWSPQWRSHLIINPWKGHESNHQKGHLEERGRVIS